MVRNDIHISAWFSNLVTKWLPKESVSLPKAFGCFFRYYIGEGNRDNRSRGRNEAVWR